MPAATKVEQSIKFERARKLFFQKESPCYMSAKLSLIEVGYKDRTAATYAPSLFKGVNEDTRVDPLKTEQLEIEIAKWVKLMSNWREHLEKVEDPMSLDSKTYSVISRYIERLAKIAGFIKGGEAEVTLNLSALPHPEQYKKLTAMCMILFQKVKSLEEEMNLTEKFSLN